MSDRIVSHPSNDAYREGWERAFGDQSQWRTGYSRLDEAFGVAWSITSSATKGKDAVTIVCESDAPKDGDAIHLKGTADLTKLFDWTNRRTGMRYGSDAESGKVYHRVPPE